MAYAFTNSKGVTYYLHAKKSTTSTGKERAAEALAAPAPVQLDDASAEEEADPAECG